MSVWIRKIIEQDIDELALIHSAALKDSLLANMGCPFLKNAMYPSLIKNSDIAGYTLVFNDEPIGFAIYGRHPNSIAKQLRSLKLAVAFALFRNIFKRPYLLRDCLTSANREKKTADTHCVHLGFIAISPERQSSGFGTILLRESVKLALRQFKATTVTVETRTEQAYKFYLRNGFVSIGHRQRGATKFHCLRFSF